MCFKERETKTARNIASKTSENKSRVFKVALSLNFFFIIQKYNVCLIFLMVIQWQLAIPKLMRDWGQVLKSAQIKK